MNGVANHAASYVFSQTGKQRADVLHLHYLASNEEHDTKRSVPADKRKYRTILNIGFLEHNTKDQRFWETKAFKTKYFRIL